MNVDVLLRAYVVETAAKDGDWIYGLLKEGLPPRRGDTPVYFLDRPTRALKQRIEDTAKFLLDFVNTKPTDDALLRFTKKYGVFSDRAVVVAQPLGLERAPRKVKAFWKENIKAGRWPYCFYAGEYRSEQEHIRREMAVSSLLFSDLPESTISEGLANLGFKDSDLLSDFARSRLYAEIEKKISEVPIEVDEIGGAPSLFVSCKTLTSAVNLALMSHVLRSESFGRCPHCENIFLRTRAEKKFCSKTCQNRHKTTPDAVRERNIKNGVEMTQ